MSVTKSFFSPNAPKSVSIRMMNESTKTNNTIDLPRRETLGFRFGLLFIGLLIVLSGGVLLASYTVFQNPLYTDISFHQRNVATGLATQTLRLVDTAEHTAVALANYAAAQKFNASALRGAALALAQNEPNADQIAAFGIWPEPGIAADRNSLYWVRDNSGAFQPRDDFNDPKSSPYSHELWYAAARLAPENRCNWAPAIVDPTSRRRTVTCAVPVKTGNVFQGVITVSLDIQKVGDALHRAISALPGYVFLLDRDGRALAVGGSARALLSEAVPAGTEIGELANKLSVYAPLAAAIHKRMEVMHEAGLHAAAFDPRVISQLQDASHGASRADAENALLWLWTRGGAPLDVETLTLDHDPALDEPSVVSIVTLSEGPGWTLIRGISSERGLAGARYLTQQTLIIALALLAAGLTIAYLLMRRTVFRPLQRIAKRLILSDRDGDTVAVALDTRAPGEIGFIAQWQNERIQQLRELSERAKLTHAQLITDASERAQLQDALTHAQELGRALLESVEHGVIVCNTAGEVLDMNPLAERMVAVLVDSARGRPLQEIFVAQMDSDTGDVLVTDVILEATQRGTPMDMSEGVLLRGIGGLTEISLSVTPLIGRDGRIDGSLVNFRKANAGAGQTGAEAGHSIEVDPHTGLGRRTACERRVRSLLDTQRLSGAGAVLVVVEIEGLQAIIRQADSSVSAEVLAVLTDLLTLQAGNAEQVFRLPADQFAVTLENTDMSSAIAWAESLYAGIGELSFQIDNAPMSLQANIGLAPIDANSSSVAAADILRRGIRAAQVAKQSGLSGGSRVLRFEASMDREATKTDDLWLNRVRRGLDENLFHLSTQWISPSSALAEEGSAFELLLALEDEEGFWSPPAAFLPVVERHGMTGEVDQWVVGRVLDQLEVSPDLLAGLAFASINLSPGTIADSNFVNYLVAALARHPQISPSKLCFDLPIGAAADPATDTPAFCEMIRLVGARICLSPGSLRQSSDLDIIRRLPVDLLSIEASHFPRIAEDPAERLLAEALVNVCREFKRRILVTRIETPQQMAAWKKLGVDYFQGYAVAKPTPVMFMAPQSY
jgi:EAL domain-containing protein (putative c-di-GMP-specific phosphodiesterase class I)/GGDEF domain-containing protein/PAS domain-containing protein